MVYSIFSVDLVFMEKFAKQNGHFLTFWNAQRDQPGDIRAILSYFIFQGTWRLKIRKHDVLYVYSKNKKFEKYHYKH